MRFFAGSDEDLTDPRLCRATFDLEAFEAELAAGEATEDKAETPAGSDGEDGPDGLDDEVVEGDDPFAKEGEEPLSKAEAAAEAKAWLKEDRDYTYTEVSR